MINKTMQYQIPKLPPQWKAQEVIRDINQQPRIVTRITLSRAHFAQRSLAPFVQIGTALTMWVEIANDEQSVRAYFIGPLPVRGTVKFGYGNEVMIRFLKRFNRDAIQWLDPERLPADIHC